MWVHSSTFGSKFASHWIAHWVQLVNFTLWKLLFCLFVYNNNIPPHWYDMNVSLPDNVTTGNIISDHIYSLLSFYFSLLQTRTAFSFALMLPTLARCSNKLWVCLTMADWFCISINFFATITLTLSLACRIFIFMQFDCWVMQGWHPIIPANMLIQVMFRK